MNIKFIYLSLLSIFISGCGTLQVNPNSNNINPVYFNAINDKSSIIIIDHDLQQYTYTGSPTEGKAWKLRKFEIPVGKPLSDAMLKQVKELIPNTKIVNRYNGNDYDSILTIKNIGIEFGVIDATNAEAKMALLGVIGAAILAGDDVIAHSKITIDATLSTKNGATNNTTLVGEGFYPSGFYSLNESVFEKSIEKAMANLSKNFTIDLEKNFLKSK